MNLSSLAFIIPSYNESQNIINLLKKIRSIYVDSQIIIIDDSSQIENEKILKHLTEFSHDKNIIYFHRNKKLGRGSAVFTGFKIALKNKKIKYMFEMDADLSHNPNEASRFISEIEKNNYDLVIGS